MSLLPDQVMIRVHDLKQAIADYTELGFTVQRGGAHADGTTHSALIGFADGSHLELMAFLKDAREHRWWDEQRRAGEGFVDYALLTGSVAGVVESAYARGVIYDGPIPGGRIRPDGTRVDWQIGRPASRDLPVVCTDLTPRFLRVAEGDARVHRNGATGLAAINVAVKNMEKSIARYRAVLGGLAVHRSVLPGHGVQLATVPLASTTITLLAPSNGTGDAQDTGSLSAELRGHLETRGEGVLGIAVYAAEAGQARTLPPDLAHGARIELVHVPPDA